MSPYPCLAVCIRDRLIPFGYSFGPLSGHSFGPPFGRHLDHVGLLDDYVGPLEDHAGPLVEHEGPVEEHLRGPLRITLVVP